MNANGQSKTIPWFLRFTPAVLRKSGLAVTTATRMAPAIMKWMSTYLDSDRSTPLPNYPQWYAPGVWVDDPNSDLDLSTLRAKIASINATLASDLVSAMEKYEGDIDAMTAREIAHMVNCLARNVGVKFSNCTERWISSWDVHILFTIEELEDAVAQAIRTANNAISAWINYIN